MGTKLTREQLLSKRSDLIACMETYNEKKYVYQCNRPFQQFGEISCMGRDTLVEAFAKLKSLATNVESASIELGLDTENTSIVGGYSYNEWEIDFKMRAEFLKEETKYMKLEAALIIIEQNLSDDDKFNIAMDMVSNLLDD